jgi:predicted transcriptional regulator
MLKNITLKIDDQLLTRVRHLAVDENKSVSAWVAELIERALNEADEYEQARREAIDTLDQGFILAVGRSDVRISMTAVDIFICYLR